MSVILDDGRTFVGEAARTLKQYENSGLQHQLRTLNWRDTLQRFPRVRPFIRAASVHTDFYRKRMEQVNKIHFTRVSAIVILGFS